MESTSMLAAAKTATDSVSTEPTLGSAKTHKLMHREVKDLEKEVDFYRDTPARLLGYANEVGESFRSLVHVNLVRFSYVVSSAYVVADTADKASKSAKLDWSSSDERRKMVFTTAVDTLIWQAFASVIIPGFTINRLCFATQKLLLKTTKLPGPARKWAATFVGLGAIPFIVKPIDAGVEIGMDYALRKFYSFHPSHDTVSNVFLEEEETAEK